MYGMTRGTTTLIGAAAAGVLLWLATQTNADTNAGYWAFVGLAAAAGFAMALSQLLGGWTKWGWPRVSGTVLLLGFLPALVAGGWVLLAGQPQSSWFADRAQNWSGDLGIGGIVQDLAAVLPAIAFGLGLTLGFVFDTSGPRARKVDVERDELTREQERVAEEPVGAERDTVVAERDEDFRKPDREVVEAFGTNDRRVEIREDGTPVATPSEPEGRRQP